MAYKIVKANILATESFPANQCFRLALAKSMIDARNGIQAGPFFFGLFDPGRFSQLLLQLLQGNFLPLHNFLALRTFKSYQTL